MKKAFQKAQGFFIIFVMSLAANSSSDFVEAQLQFSKAMAPGQEVTCRWNPSTQQLGVRLFLEWQYFNPEIQVSGYDLSRSVSSYLIFPNTSEGCSYKSASGLLYGQQSPGITYVDMIFQGKSCGEEDMMNRLNTGNIVLSFYSVPILEEQLAPVGVLRIQIWDHFSHTKCSVLP